MQTIAYIKYSFRFWKKFKGSSGLHKLILCRRYKQKRSFTGYLFVFGKCAISWKGTFQAIVDLSTTEVEYMKIIKVVKEAIWLRDLFGELVNKHDATIVYYDSQSAIHLTKD